MSDDFFTGYDILKHGEHDNEALSQTAITFAAAPECGSIHEELDPTPHLKMENQSSYPGCTGNSITTGLECIAGLQCGDWSQMPQLSRKFAWLNGQLVWMGRTNLREGCTIQHVVEAAMRDGVCLESLCPYEFGSTQLTAAQRENAKSYRALNQTPIRSADDMRNFLDGGYGFVLMGVNWTRRMSDTRGVIDLKDVREGRDSVGGHAIPAVGFRRNGNYVIPNSWGKSFAINGVAEFTPAAIDYLCDRPYTVMRGITDLTGFDKTRQLESWGMG